MVPLLSAALAALVAVACVNEARSTSMKVMSMEEIMNRTTVESAVKLVLGMNGTHLRPELASLIQAKFGLASRGSAKAASSLRAVQRHRQAPTGYAAVEGAMNMLAEMMTEANNKLDLEVSACGEFDETQMGLMRATRNDVATFNAEANRALGAMLKAQGLIASVSTQLGELKDQLAAHNKQCDEDIAETKKLLAIVTADVNVMGVILNLTQCGASDASAASVALVQTGEAVASRSNSSDEVLVDCGHCLGGKGMIMLQNDQLQPLLNKLQSMFAQKYLQKQLRITFRQAMRGRTPVALSQVGVAHQLKLVKGMSPPVLAEVGVRHRLHRRSENETNGTLEEVGYNVAVADVPKEPMPMDCIPTDKCTLGPANCALLQERFENIHGGLVEKMQGLQAELAELERFCEETRETMEGQIADLEQQLGQEQANLAQATGDKSEAEAGSHNKATQYDELHGEYGERMKACCDNQNELKSEKCALEKIRGELLKLEGVDIFVVDCETSDWEEQECTVSCGGGERISSRSILVQAAEGGMPCPALEKTEPCNTFECPVDCILNDWEGWSSCNAECGGGVRERTRSIRTEPAHGGQACGELSDSEVCNNEACDADCVLQDWTEWTACSKYCDGGSQERSRDIATPAKGTGTCAVATDGSRMQYSECNTYTCESILPVGRSLLQCNSKVDIIIALDSSGSLGSYGWEQSKAFAERLIGAIEGGDEKAWVALEVFSHNIEWVSHFTNDTAALAAKVKNINWMGSVTYTHTALLSAESELIRGREDANTIVVVITDGWPSYAHTTWLASMSLLQKARIVWVPAGPGAPVELIEYMASEPKKDHIVRINTFEQMTDSEMINKIIADTCPIIE